MAPPPLCRITSAAWRVQSAVPTTFTPSERCQSSTLASSPFRTNTAASFTSTSRRPWRSDTTPNACATSASRAMSVRTKSAGAPAARRRAATSSPAGSTSRSTTEAPSSANSSAVASPIPAAAPVTAATLPASRPRSLIEQPAAREHVAAEHLGGIDGVRLGLAAQATEDRIAARLLVTPLGGEAAGADPVQRGPQAVPHLPVDVQDLGCEFYVFSGHKLFAPTGVGILYGKTGLLERMPPYQGGGDMISMVTFEKTHYNVLPYKFEAGTPHIAGGIGLAAAIEYVTEIGLDAIAAYEHELLRYATEALATVAGLEMIGTAREKASVLSFVLDGVHPHDIGTILDRDGIAIRAGHHCAMPVMQRFGVPATARASLALYNTRA